MLGKKDRFDTSLSIQGRVGMALDNSTKITTNRSSDEFGDFETTDVYSSVWP